MTPEEELETVERYMRERGHRWTNQRRLIADVAFGTHEHFTADELLDMCRRVDSQVSRATVYRTLAMLEEAGFVEGLDTGENGRRFEHVLGHEHHDHMLCQDCGRIVEFADPELERLKEAVAAQHGFRLVSHTLKLVVACQNPDCEFRRQDRTES
ncbi:MAG: transcriptional repressor [Planctomycetes bacterium]|nr:transcriptional repressor [Planctomycetota bacterium]